MASSEENPASAAPEKENTEGNSEQSESSDKPKKKTLIGLGKLRESLKKSSSGKKSTSLRIPKPSGGKKKRKTSLGLPRPDGPKPPKKPKGLEPPKSEQAAAHESSPPAPKDSPPRRSRSTLSLGSVSVEDTGNLEDTDNLKADEASTVLDPGARALRGADDDESAPSDEGPTTDRMEDVPQDTYDDEEPDTDRIEAGAYDDEGPTTDQMSADELAKSMPELGVPGGVSKQNGSKDPSGDSVDSSLLEDVEIEGPIDAPIEGDATMLTDSPFEKQSTPAFGAEPAPSGAGTDDDFGAEATMVTDSPLDKAQAGEQEFGAEATMVTDSPLDETASEGDFDGDDKTMVSMPDASTNPDRNAGPPPMRKKT